MDLNGNLYWSSSSTAGPNNVNWGMSTYVGDAWEMTGSAEGVATLNQLLDLETGVETTPVQNTYQPGTYGTYGLYA